MAFFSEETYLGWIDQLADQDFVVIDNFISPALYTTIFSFFEVRLAEDDLAKAGIGALGLHTIDKKIRGDYVYWLDENKDSELNLFYAQVNELVEKIRRYCFLPISDFECHLAYYPAGTFYKKHLDQFKERNNRLISFVLYLNPNWRPNDGGELVIYKKGETQLVEPLCNRLVLFKSDCVPHEVSLTNVPRYSLTGWMLNNPVGLGFLG